MKMFSDGICMEYGRDKILDNTFIRKRLTSRNEIKVDERTNIAELDQKDNYKYLGRDKGDRTQYKKMNKNVRKEYHSRVRNVL